MTVHLIENEARKYACPFAARNCVASQCMAWAASTEKEVIRARKQPPGEGWTETEVHGVVGNSKGGVPYKDPSIWVRDWPNGRPGRCGALKE